MVTSTEHVFVSGKFAVHDFLMVFDVCRIFLSITLELFCVFQFKFFISCVNL